MPQRFVGLLIGLGLLLSVVPAVSAQEMAVRDISLLKALGLPEVNLVATETEVTGAPAALAAGRYLVTLENRTADTEVEAYIISPPAGLDAGQVATELNADSSEPPAWLYDATIAGGPNSYGRQTDGAVVNLSAGNWWFLTERSSDPEVWTIATVTVNGDALAPTSVAGAVPLDLREYAFVLPETVNAGQQIWEVTNHGEQPHFFVLAKLPDGTTFDAVMSFLMSLNEDEGTPAATAATAEPGGLSEADFAFIYDASIVSAGQTALVQVELESGTYGLLCWFPDKDTGAPHVAMGMLNVFTVA